MKKISINYSRRKTYNVLIILCTVILCVVICSATRSNAFLVYIDDKPIVYLANKNEISELIDKVGKYYIDLTGLNTKDISENSLINKISFVRCTVDYKKLMTVDGAANYIIKSNKQNTTQLLTFSISGIKSTDEIITPGVMVTWSNDLLKGQSNVESPGKNGKSTKITLFTFENNKLITENIISSTIIETAKSRIIVNGSREPIIVATSVITVPSRGTISSEFGKRWGKTHKGIDIAASFGTPIYSAFDGVVKYSGWEEGYGNLIQIKSDGNIETLYGHCSNLSAKVGTLVKKGDKIRNVGSTGNSTGPHVHFEVRINGIAVDPIKYLK